MSKQLSYWIAWNRNVFDCVLMLNLIVWNETDYLYKIDLTLVSIKLFCFLDFFSIKVDMP